MVEQETIRKVVREEIDKDWKIVGKVVAIGIIALYFLGIPYISPFVGTEILTSDFITGVQFMVVFGCALVAMIIKSW